MYGSYSRSEASGCSYNGSKQSTGTGVTYKRKVCIVRMDKKYLGTYTPYIPGKISKQLSRSRLIYIAQDSRLHVTSCRNIQLEIGTSLQVGHLCNKLPQSLLDAPSWLFCKQLFIYTCVQEKISDSYALSSQDNLNYNPSRRKI